MARLEADEERDFAKWCKKQDILTIKFTPFGDCGWPDRICIMPGGLHVWMEMKRRGKKPRRLQDHRIQMLRIRGANAHWADCAEDAIEILEGYL